MAEHIARTYKVVGSIPALGSNPCNGSFFKLQHLRIGVSTRLSEKSEFFISNWVLQQDAIISEDYYEQMQFDN